VRGSAGGGILTSERGERRDRALSPTAGGSSRSSCRRPENPVTLERSWPRRFRVSIQTNSGVTQSYSVVTWRSREKAVAIAVMTHVRRRDAGHGPMGIQDVAVVEAGPPERHPDGTVSLERADLTDRMEW
jgi:hypothetical protein